MGRHVELGRAQRALIVAVLGLAVLGAFWARALPAVAAQPSPTPGSSQQLQEQKLREEILNLRRERSLLRIFPAYAGVLTALVGVGGLIFTALKHIDERAKDRLQREAESRRRLEESFATCTANLGAEGQARQASAAVTLLSFLKADPAYAAFHEQVFLLTLANLKIEHSEPVRRLLVRVFERAARRHIPALGDEERAGQLDLTRITLDGADLSGLDLSGADVAFASLRRANLSGEATSLKRVRGYGTVLDDARLSRANLNEARLRRAHCWDAKFHEANLVAARLGEADLQGAEFYRAKMQGADLRGADLRGAKFKGANVADADFRGAELDDAAQRELVWTNWRETGKLDPALKAKLEALSRAAQ